jgi:glyoxylase-like metal-dependent hydrolase (beta-lactamase superfamily II)
MTKWRIGEVTITKVVEVESSIDLDKVLPDLEVGMLARYDWLKPHFVDDDGRARMSVHGLVIDTGGRRILVDPCIGAQRTSLPFPPLDEGFLERLAEAGYAVDDIDTVLCTHLHFDHVGWNTRLVDGEWVVTFPNARYLFGRVEWEHWQTHGGAYGDTNIDETVRPVLAAGQADLVEMDHELCREVRLVPTPGHTPGHVSVVIESGGERAVIAGDLAHHPIQYAEPQLSMYADDDPAAAMSTRRAFLAERAADGALTFGTHFAAPSAGTVVRSGDAWRFVT